MYMVSIYSCAMYMHTVHMYYTCTFAEGGREGGRREEVGKERGGEGGRKWERGGKREGGEGGIDKHWQAVSQAGRLVSLPLLSPEALE